MNVVIRKSAVSTFKIAATDYKSFCEALPADLELDNFVERCQSGSITNIGAWMTAIPPCQLDVQAHAVSPSFMMHVFAVVAYLELLGHPTQLPSHPDTLSTCP